MCIRIPPVLAGTAFFIFVIQVGSPEFCSSAPCDSLHSVVIPRLEAPEKIPVDLDRPPWTKAARVTGFVDINSDRMAEHPTWVSLFYDSVSLWVAFRCEGQPGADLQAEIAEHDGPVWRDDAVELFCDPAHTHRDYFHLAVNCAGTIYDASGSDTKWESKAEVKTATDDRGWTLVARLPFSAMQSGAPRPGDVWALNLCRNRTSQARSAWSPVRKTFLVPESFGHIVFGSQNAPAAQLRKVAPIVIGLNHISLAGDTVASCRIRGKDKEGEAIFSETKSVQETGRVSFRLPTDEVRRLEIDLLAEKGDSLATWWLPVETPSLALRVAAIRGRSEIVRTTLETSQSGYAPDARRKTKDLLDELEPVLRDAEEIVGDPEKHSPKNWEHLAAVVPGMERKIDGPWCYAQTVLRFPGESPPDFAVGVTGPMRKVMIRDFPFEGSIIEVYSLSLAANEHEGFQVVVIPFHRDLNNVTVSVSKLRGRSPAQEFAGETQVSLVGHVKVGDKQPYDVEYRGWWPDPLLSFQQSCDAHVGEHIAFWIDVSTEVKASADDYEGTVRVEAEGCRPIELRLKVHVWDFRLPNGTRLRNAFTYDLQAAKRIYRDAWTSELARRYHDFILDHRLNIDHLYRKQPEDIGLLQYGVSRGMNAFNVKYVSKGAGVEKIMEILDDCVPELKAAGLFDLAYVYGFDEVSKEYFPRIQELFGTIHRKYPGLETMTTAYDFSFGRGTGLREVVDIWVPLIPYYSLEEAVKLRREGKDMWWYACITPLHPYPNWFVEYPAIEPRLLMGAMSYKYKTGGFLYYMMNRWWNNRGPITSGPYTSWDPGSAENRRGEVASGDGSLFCPGPDRPLSTIRLENIRDGLEDYEYLSLLRDLLSEIEARPEALDRRSWLEPARELLSVPPKVVTTLTDFTSDSNDVDSFRRQLAEAIEKGRQLAR
jgi:hypothetical protein